MLKGLAITPPVVGRISIGRVVEKNGKRLPEKDDQFTITTQVQTRDGWLLHPQDEAQRKQHGGDKLRSIDILLPFNDPDLNLRAEYAYFDRGDGRPICIGDGETCRRDTDEGMQTMPCYTPDNCGFHNRECKPYGRLYVVIGDQDELGTFVLRTTSYNSIRTLAARMRYFHAVSGGLLACMPLELRLRGKSTTQSFRTAIYYVDLVIGYGMTLAEAIRDAQRLDAQRREAGFDQDALDKAARLGFANGAFEESVEDVPAVVEEFFPDAKATDLASKLEAKAGRLGSSAARTTSTRAAATGTGSA
ncbi:recombination directionality factor [Bordetella genomosp. 13]|uniref:Hydrolase or metal-binding protein n=1 Tax=Bordetella genomosp. 13 TaxID=463040 RepID=A0A1W6ZCX8_9BORD|nr:hydrolase or metal-binding protein [Bordetella genomosp. 13]ARP95246.1 hydrolase or metal-binding protein [Bordetella genomosp. 13]